METFNKITIYETKTRLYIVGSNYYENYRILKIDRTTPKELNLSFDNVDYTSKECSDLLLRIHLGNQHIGGLTRVLNCFGLVGFVKFTQGYYICLITKRKAIACIGGSYIYHIEDTTMLDISEPFNKIENKSEEERYINIFSNVDLSKNFYFSYNYNLTQSLQNNINDLINNDFNINTRFVWNHHLLKNGFGKKCLLNSSPWILPLIHGFLDQARISILGRSIYITLIARRSRYFAGARFLKRGSNEEGQVANEVETEQIVNDSTITSLIVNNQLNPNYTSYLQHRGSIPLCWGQDNSNMAPKPSIHILKRDPFATMAAGHFNDLFLRYGNKVIVLNLIKRKEKTPRESKLLKEFNQAIKYLKSCVEEKNKNQLYYVEWDMSRASKSPDEDVIEYLENFAEDALQQTNFFHSGAELYAWSNNKEKEKEKEKESNNNQQQYKFLLQNGIVRTNCIDCIDRTNAAQFLIGKCALSHQLHALGIIMDTYLPFDCDAVDMLTEMYHDHGDTLALQYGGSNLVNTMATYRNNNRNWSSHSRDIVEAIRRFYTNSFVDADKQDGMNLFLGKFKVNEITLTG
ncbi:hypothetical protein K502DRAFT_335587 [Neoconidiobolus thromboides FSU 785]|nr:hypothetical protein K502DRAFT_335587 [Neoconidiobolus thromboides FSU 785]